MLPTKPVHFIGGGLLLLAIMIILSGNVMVGMVFAVLGTGLIFSRFFVKEVAGDKGAGDPHKSGDVR